MQYIGNPNKKIQAQPTSKPQRGFTLVELMMVITIMVFIVSLGAPGFRDFIAPSRMHAWVSLYTQAVQTARHIAVSSHRTVTLCELDTNNRCTGHWGKHLDLFFDAERDGIRQNETDTIVQMEIVDNAPLQVVWRGFGQRRFLSVHGNGSYRQNGRFTFCTSEAADRPGRALVINVAGRSRVEATQCAP